MIVIAHVTREQDISTYQHNVRATPIVWRNFGLEALNLLLDSLHRFRLERVTLTLW